MATIVDIIIKGVAICYRHGADWHVLFPIDAEGCHKINFSYQKEDAKEPSPETPLASSKSINITVKGTGAISTTGETDNFRLKVLDLTSDATHPRIRQRKDLNGDLTGKAVLLTIPNAHFSINKYLEQLSNDPIPDLEQVPPGAKTQFSSLAHSAKATIILNDGAQLIVASNQLPKGEFVTDLGSSYKLTFNNDCDKERKDKNDMDMFYEVIEEFDDVTGNRVDRKFRIGGVGTKDGKIAEQMIEQLIRAGIDKKFIEPLIRAVAPSEPPSFAIGKPCLFVKASKPGDLP
jgi:hypothetical protein